MAPVIIHAFSDYKINDEETQRRHSVARSTWPWQGWKERPIADKELPRLFPENTKRLPYIRDLMDLATEGCDEGDIVVFSNADIGFASDASWQIALALQANAAGYAFRRDFKRLDAPPSNEDIAKGASYAGTDVFFFRAGWWANVGQLHFPDLLLGREAWDACFRVLIEDTNPNKPLAVENLCWHERHGGIAYWEDPTNRYRLPGQRYNLKLAISWLREVGRNPSHFGIPQRI